MIRQIIQNRNRSSILILISLIMGLGISLSPLQLQAADTYITITEEADTLDSDEIIKFAVNTDYDNIVAFAISHSAAYEGNAGINNDLVPWYFAEPPEDWYATTITWDEGNSNWKEYEDDRIIDWLGSEDLPTDQGAWLFTCYNGVEEDGYYGDALWSPGTTGGFYGITGFPMSEFAAFDNNIDITLTGDTTVVPLPSAIWLLGSSIIGMVGIRRKFKK